jgi:GAF domain-containing protein
VAARYGETVQATRTLTLEEGRQYVHPEDLARMIAAFEGALAGGAGYDVEYRLLLPDGRMAWIASAGRVQRDDAGRAVRAIGVTRDITREKEAEARLRESLALLSASEQQQRFLAELTERKRARSHPDEAAEEVVRAVGEYLHASRCSFVELDEEAQMVTVRYDWRREDSIPRVERTFPLTTFGAFGAGEQRAGRTLVVADVATDERLEKDSRAAYAAVRAGALVNVPIIKAGRWVGSLAVNDAAPRAWTEDEIQLIETVAERTWLAVENARLWQDLEQDRARQARVAEALQRSLLVRPDLLSFDHLDVYPFYEAATDEARIGGDLYDAFALDDGKVALVVGDATGKGLSAASDAAAIKFTLRAYLREDADPAAALVRMNQHLFARQRLEGYPVTALLCLAVAVVDVATGETQVCTAGTESPLLLRTGLVDKR